MSVRRLIVEVDTDGLNVRQFCAEHGCSTWFFYDLRRRFKREGEAALEPKSRAPKTVWNKTPDDVEDLIVETRKRLKDLGLDYGPEEVAAELTSILRRPLSPATAYRILRARGFITPEPNKAPKRSRRRFSVERANESWQLDDTGWELADGTEVKILNVGAGPVPSCDPWCFDRGHLAPPAPSLATGSSISTSVPGIGGTSVEYGPPGYTVRNAEPLLIVTRPPARGISRDR